MPPASAGCKTNISIQPRAATGGATVTTTGQRTTRGPWPWSIIATVGLSTPLMACGSGLGAKQALADRVIKSSSLAEKAGTAEGTVSLTFHAIESAADASAGAAATGAVGGQQAAGRRLKLPDVVVGGVPFQADLAHRRAELGAGPGRPEGPIAMITEQWTTVYQRSLAQPGAQATGAAASVGGLASVANAATEQLFGGPLGLLSLQAAAGGATGKTRTATDAPSTRRWYRLRFGDLPPKQPGRTVGAYYVSPDLIIALLRGTLSGSTRQVATEKLGDRSTVHYKMNVDPQKATSRLSGREKDALTNLLNATGVPTSDGVATKSAFKGDVWLDAEGMPVRVVVRLPQSLDRHNRGELTVQVDVSRYGAPAAIPRVKPDDVANVSTIGQMVRSVGAATGTPAPRFAPSLAAARLSPLPFSASCWAWPRASPSPARS